MDHVSTMVQWSMAKGSKAKGFKGPRVLGTRFEGSSPRPKAPRVQVIFFSYFLRLHGSRSYFYHIFITISDALRALVIVKTTISAIKDARNLQKTTSKCVKIESTRRMRKNFESWFLCAFDFANHALYLSNT